MTGGSICSLVMARGMELRNWSCHLNLAQGILIVTHSEVLQSYSKVVNHSNSQFFMNCTHASTDRATLSQRIIAAAKINSPRVWMSQQSALWCCCFSSVPSVISLPHSPFRFYAAVFASSLALLCHFLVNRCDLQRLPNNSAQCQNFRRGFQLEPRRQTCV